MKADKEKMMCDYLENMAAKIGGDVRVIKAASGHFMMYRNGDFIHGVRVSMEDSRDDFNAKVKKLIEK